MSFVSGPASVSEASPCSQGFITPWGGITGARLGHCRSLATALQNPRRQTQESASLPPSTSPERSRMNAEAETGPGREGGEGAGALGRRAPPWGWPGRETAKRQPDSATPFFQSGFSSLHSEQQHMNAPVVPHQHQPLRSPACSCSQLGASIALSLFACSLTANKAPVRAPPRFSLSPFLGACIGKVPSHFGLACPSLDGACDGEPLLTSHVPVCRPPPSRSLLPGAAADALLHSLLGAGAGVQGRCLRR